MTAAARNMKRAEPRENLVSVLRSGSVGTIGQLADCLEESVPIDPGLPRAEVIRSPFYDVRKIEFRGSAEANAPFWLRHTRLIRLFWKSPSPTGRPGKLATPRYCQIP
jgi:hypothetical protein